jgi:hypothetical protein
MHRLVGILSSSTRYRDVGPVVGVAETLQTVHL